MPLGDVDWKIGSAHTTTPVAGAHCWSAGVGAGVNVGVIVGVFVGGGVSVAGPGVFVGSGVGQDPPPPIVTFPSCMF
jgi:hypothetical protein